MHMSLLIPAFLQSLGIAAVVSISYELILRRQVGGSARSGLIALLFAGAAVATMSLPVEMDDGIYFDLRHVFIVLSAIYGGLPALILAFVGTATQRLFEGGAGMSAGVAGIAISALAGYACARFCKLPKHSPARLFLLGLLPSLSLLSIFVMPFDMAVTVFNRVGPAMVLGNFLGVVLLLSLLMKREGQYVREIELERWAQTDRLTGTFNRLKFDSTAPVLIQKSLNNRKFAALLLIDIDHFKRINDTFGHTAGDVVLVRIAEILEQELKPSDLLARYGGEEFVAVIVNTSETEAHQIARRICSVLAAAQHEIRGSTVSVTVSIGLHVIKQPQLNLVDAIRAADVALYSAKNNGRNRVEYTIAA